MYVKVPVPSFEKQNASYLFKDNKIFLQCQNTLFIEENLANGDEKMETNLNICFLQTTRNMESGQRTELLKVEDLFFGKKSVIHCLNAILLTSI